MPAIMQTRTQIEKYHSKLLALIARFAARGHGRFLPQTGGIRLEDRLDLIPHSGKTASTSSSAPSPWAGSSKPQW
jgi:hypothetical protein